MSKYKSLQKRMESFSKILPCDLRNCSPCLCWTGYTQKDGYISSGDGYGRINLTRNGRSLKFPVHRVAKILEELHAIKPDFDFYDSKDKQSFFELYDAYLLSGLTIDHLCKQSLCFNADHLEWVKLAINNPPVELEGMT